MEWFEESNGECGEGIGGKTKRGRRNRYEVLRRSLNWIMRGWLIKARNMKDWNEEVYTKRPV